MNADDDRVWKALADARRRRILECLQQRPHTTGELVGLLAASRFAVMKHLAVLVAAGLVRFEWLGRERRNQLDATPMRRACARWLRKFEAGATSRPAARQRRADVRSKSPVERRVSHDGRRTLRR